MELIAIGTYQFTRDNDTMDPPLLCKRFYSRGSIFAFNESFDFDSTVNHGTLFFVFQSVVVLFAFEQIYCCCSRSLNFRLSYYSGDAGVIELKRSLATLPRWIQEPLVVRDGDVRPQEEPLAARVSSLLRDLLGVSRSMERDLSVLSIYPRIFLCVFLFFVEIISATCLTCCGVM